MIFIPLAEMTDNQKAVYGALPLDKFSFDNGYYAQKFFSTKLPKGGSLRTLMGTTTQPMSSTSAVLQKREILGVELKDTNSPMRYLFGMHADEQLGVATTTKSSDDVTQGNTKLRQFFTASLRLMLPQPGQYRAWGVVMMPVSAFKDPAFKDNVKDTLRGLYQFEALTKFDEGRPVYESYTVLVEKLIVMEQPLGSFFKVVLDPESKVNFEDISKKRNTFLDWGAGTLDVLTLEGISRPVDKMCGAANAGINVLFDVVRQAAFTPNGLNPSPMELEAAVMAGRYQNNRHPKFWPANADDKGFVNLAPHIQQGVEAMWQLALQLFDETIGTTAESIANIFITGGPSGWMQPYVLDHFGAHRVFKVMDAPAIDPQLPYRHLMLSDDLHLRNAQGGFMYALTIKE